MNNDSTNGSNGAYPFQPKFPADPICIMTIMVDGKRISRTAHALRTIGFRGPSEKPSPQKTRSYNNAHKMQVQDHSCPAGKPKKNQKPVTKNSKPIHKQSAEQPGEQTENPVTESRQLESAPKKIDTRQMKTNPSPKQRLRPSGKPLKGRKTPDTGQKRRRSTGSRAETVEKGVAAVAHADLPSILEISSVGIDTIVLSADIRPKAVRAGHAFKITPVRKDRNDHLLFIDSAGEAVIGSSALWQNEFVHLKITRDPKYYGYKFGYFNYAKLRVQFSVAKICGRGDNTRAVGRAETEKALEYVAQTLREIGIDVDLSEATVTRLDLFRNLLLRLGALKPYLAVINTLHLSCKEKETYDTGNLDHNKSESFLFYEKNAERSSKDLDVASTDDVLRSEWQMKKTAHVKKGLGLQKVTVAQLLAHFDDLHRHYAEAYRRSYFRQAPTMAKPRRFAGGYVSHQLDSLWKGLQKYEWAAGWTRKALQETLAEKEFSGLMTELKAATKGTLNEKASVSERNWLNRRLGELKKALVREALESPEFAHCYAQLKHWLVGPETTLA